MNAFKNRRTQWQAIIQTHIEFREHDNSGDKPQYFRRPLPEELSVQAYLPYPEAPKEF